jgi:hypothetical protein
MGATYASFFWEMGAGIVGTPGRMLDAGRRGHWFELGREASLFAPVVKGVGRFAGNRIVRRLPAEPRRRIRQFQAERILNGWGAFRVRGREFALIGGMRHRVRHRLRRSLDTSPEIPLHIEYDPRLRIPTEVGPAVGLYDPLWNSISISEGAWQASFFGGRLPLRQPGPLTPRRIGTWGPEPSPPRFHWRDRTAWWQLLKGESVGGLVFHEVWHALQHNRWPRLWQEGAVSGVVGYLYDVREVAHPGRRVPGAYDAQYRWGPMHPAQFDALWMLDLSLFQPATD